jgi:L,D-peptidoglycan transpeptidase YkuD (ErfK/YbiS/YcfS/YnhG family)
MRSFFLGLLFALPLASHAGEVSEPLLAQLEKGQTQALVVTGSDPTAVTLNLWERRGSRWRRVLGPVPATIGRTGFINASEKREGDGHTPTGVYPIGLVFGYEKKFQTKMPYRQATEDDIWIDDPESPQYNSWQRKPTGAKSFELMRRSDDLYKLGAVIEYNTKPARPGMGSAIFFHVWPGLGKTTNGCVGADAAAVRAVLSRLSPARHPVVVLSAQY